MQWFKKFLTFLGAVFLIILLGLAALWAWSKGLDKSSRIFAEQTVQSVFTTWDYEAFKNRADPVMFATTSETDFKGAFERISKLGKLKSLEGCQGASAINIGGNNSQPNTTAQYNCRIVFENDTASIIFTLLRGEDGLWRVGGMHVESNYLINLKN